MPGSWKTSAWLCATTGSASSFNRCSRPLAYSWLQTASPVNSENCLLGPRLTNARRRFVSHPTSFIVLIEIFSSCPHAPPPIFGIIIARKASLVTPDCCFNRVSQRLHPLRSLFAERGQPRLHRGLSLRDP